MLRYCYFKPHSFVCFPSGIVASDFPRLMQEAPSRVIPQEQCRQQHEGLLDIGDSAICGLTGGNNEPRACGVRKILTLSP